MGFDIDKVETKICVYCHEYYNGLEGDNSGGAFDYQNFISRTVCTECGAPLCILEDYIDKHIRIVLKHNSKFEIIIDPISGLRSLKMVLENIHELFRESRLLFKIEENNLLLLSSYATEPSSEWHILDKKILKNIIFNEIDLLCEFWYEEYDVLGLDRVYLTKIEKMFHICIREKDIRIKRKALYSFLKAKPSSNILMI